jgi:hypothetical protein
MSIRNKLLAAILALHGCSPAWADGISNRISGNAVGVDGIYNPISASSYVGPGDLVPGASFWVGLRAYSAATAGTKAVRLVRASDSTQQDFNTLANGNLDVASITTFLASTTGNIVTLYDQTGNGQNFTDATAQAVFQFNTIGSLPGIHFIRANASRLGMGSPSLSATQPFTISTVGQSVSNGGYQLEFETNTDNVHMGFIGTNFEQTAGSESDVAISLNTFYAVQAQFNGASSSLYINGTSNATSPGTNGPNTSGGDWWMGGIDGGTNLQGNMTEMGLWPSAFSAGQQAAMNANQRAYWGF